MDEVRFMSQPAGFGGFLRRVLVALSSKSDSGAGRGSDEAVSALVKSFWLS